MVASEMRDAMGSGCRNAFTKRNLELYNIAKRFFRNLVLLNETDGRRG
jgi:hypothetical protein